MSAHQQLPVNVADPRTTGYSIETTVNRLVCWWQNIDIKLYQVNTYFYFPGSKYTWKEQATIFPFKLTDFWVSCKGGGKSGGTPVLTNVLALSLWKKEQNFEAILKIQWIKPVKKNKH